MSPLPRIAPPQSDHVAPSLHPIDGYELTGIVRTYDRDQRIFSEGDSADRIYKVVRGAVRCLRILSDGRRQISDFLLPGDLFGLEAGHDRQATAEAVCDCAIIVARLSRMSAEPEFAGMASRLWRCVLRDLQRTRDHLLTLGRRTASERIASFLIDMGQRLGDRDKVELPMSRQDMADYLGLTIETVSRTLAQLEARGLIEARCSRSIVLRNTPALRRLCE